MKKMNESINRTATVCAVCHDQCVSACPVFEATRRMSAYPSRLAMLALELNRNGLDPDLNVARRLQDCIGCGACLEGCLYIDQPNDITPVVRWARQITRPWATPELEIFLEKIRKFGSPYADALERLSTLRSELPTKGTGDPILLYTDAATLHYAPKMAVSSIRLLQQLGWQNIKLAEQVYPGGELREQGCEEEFRAVASGVIEEILAVKPAMIVSVHPYSAYLLREVFPTEVEAQLNVPVYTLAEMLETRLDRLAGQQRQPVFLVQSAAESYRMGGGAGRRLLERLGAHVSGYREDLYYRDISYPDGEVFGIEPDPRELTCKRIAQAFRQSGVEQIITTSPEALVGFTEIKVTDLATYLCTVL